MKGKNDFYPKNKESTQSSKEIRSQKRINPGSLGFKEKTYSNEEFFETSDNYKKCLKQNCSSKAQNQNETAVKKERTLGGRASQKLNSFGKKGFIDNKNSSIKRDRSTDVKTDKNNNQKNGKKIIDSSNSNESIEVIFDYCSSKIIIQTKTDNKVENIIDQFISKAKTNKLNKTFIYNGNIIEKKNFSKKLFQIMNKFDIERKGMNIMVNDNSDSNKEITEKIVKDFICPECFENIFISLENFKINYVCNNNHCKKLMNINEYEALQKMDLTKIICEQCKNNTKANTYNNEFYHCQNCKINLCPLCENAHKANQNHTIIKFDSKNYYCPKHNEKFIEYCKECKQNICFSCKNDHRDHKELIDLQNMVTDKEEIQKEFKETKELIDKIKKFIDDIEQNLNSFKKNIDILYCINNNFIESYDVSKRNYQILQNLNEIRNFNNSFYNELKCISEEQSISNKISHIIDIYTKMSMKSCEKIYLFGEKYIGEINNELRNGKGKMYYNDDKRDYYEGDWKDDLYEGKGKLVFKNGSYYLGDWKGGLKEGKGIYQYESGDIYEGYWKNDKIEGKGVYCYKNGNKYEGDIENDVFEGNGIFYWANGDKYIGEFKGYKAEGKGVLFHENGEIEMGIFSKGQKIGKYALLNMKNKLEFRKSS